MVPNDSPPKHIPFSVRWFPAKWTRRRPRCFKGFWGARTDPGLALPKLETPTISTETLTSAFPWPHDSPAWTSLL